MTRPESPMCDVPLQSTLWPDTIQAYDVTLPTAAENLALDEALLSCVDADPAAASLRFWQPETLFVVLGRSNQEQTEVNLEACASAGIPVFRRASGGGTVIVGPGCLCYALALPLTEAHRSAGVSRLAAEVMSRTAAALCRLIPNVQVRGTSDLTLNGLKFSGNAQRWLRRSFIHHGTLLFDFDLSLCGTFLNHPSREPSYRELRPHSEFVANVPLAANVLRDCVRSAWNAVPADLPSRILDEVTTIATSRYLAGEWQILPRS